MLKNNQEKMPAKILGSDLSSKIYTIRGTQVMLDFDLAEIYGYSTKAFNQQVNRNIERFDDDFRFQLTLSELENLRSQNVTANMNRSLPYAFTEEGIYMLMAVLKGELAVEQSKNLIRLFRSMKNYIVEHRAMMDYHENLQLISKVANNTEDIIVIKYDMQNFNKKIEAMSKRIENAVKRSEISPILLDFSKVAETREFLIMNGEPARAKETFMDIYGRAKSRICIVDNYIDIRTLRLLQDVEKNIEITFFTDNIRNTLYRNDYEMFKIERPDLKMKFIRTNNQIHDRFIILDDDAVYQCGASPKDAGKKLTTVYELTTPEVKDSILKVVARLAKNPELDLK